MKSIFCSKCGTKLFYGENTPEKCTGCGRKFGESEETPTKQSSAKKAPPQDEEEQETVPVIENVQIDVQIERPQAMTLKDIWLGAPEGEPPEEKYTREGSGLEIDSALATIFDECKPVTQSKDVGE